MSKNPNGHEYEYQMLSASQIKIDESYQRPIDDKQVNDIVKAFNGDIFNEPKVSYRDGLYWCFDGQRSLAAWKLFHKSENVPIMCKVFFGMTWENEVDAFILQSGFSKAVKANYKLRAMYNKHDPEVVDMVNIIENYGWVVDWYQHGSKGKIDAISKLYACYKKLGSYYFKEMMEVVREAWGNNNKDAVSANILGGMTALYAKCSGKFSKKDLISALKKELPEKIIERGKQLKKSATKFSNPYAYIIVDVYNKGKRDNMQLNKSLFS